MNSCLILVGGFGTRIKQQLGNVPKPLAIVYGKPFLFWILQYLKKNNFQHIYLLTYYQKNQFEQFIENNKLKGLTISIVEEIKPLGTGGSILNALKSIDNLDDNFLVINGDSLALINIFDFFNEMKRKKCLGIVGIEQDNCSRYGCLHLNKNNELLKFNEKLNNGPGIINSGIYFFNKSILSTLNYDDKKMSLETDLIPSILKIKFPISVKIYRYVPFIDIGTPQSLSFANQFLKDNLEKLMV